MRTVDAGTRRRRRIAPWTTTTADVRRTTATPTTLDEAQAAIDEARRRVAEVPAEVVVTNHVMGLYELAAIHLSADPPDLRAAALAIDAVACLVDGLGDRLGAEAATMRDAWPTSASRSSRSRRAAALARRADAAEPPGRRRRAPGRCDDDALGAQQLRPARARGGGQPAVAGTTRHHGTSSAGCRQERDPTARAAAGVAGHVGDVAVAVDLAGAEAPAITSTMSFAPSARSSPGSLSGGRRSAASSRPSLASRSNSTSAPTAIVRVPSAISTQWNRYASPSSVGDVRRAHVLVELGDDRAAFRWPSWCISGRSWRSGSRADRWRRRP